jgi:hypothetical protein
MFWNKEFFHLLHEITVNQRYKLPFFIFHLYTPRHHKKLVNNTSP